MKQPVLKRILLPALLAIGLSSPATVFAETGDIALGLKGSTVGLGGEATIGLLSNLNLRGGYNAFTYKDSGTESGIDYDYKLKLKSVPVLLDFHPFGSGFRITSGIFFNNNKVTGTPKTTSGIINIGGTEYDLNPYSNLIPPDFLHAKIDFRTTAPYLGIGWGNPVSKGSPLTIMCDVGVIFQGKPKVSLDPNFDVAAVSTLPGFENIANDIAEEETELKDAVKDIQYYPVISLGIAYRF